eukprot:m.100563 g.100563  ORF g.100563 m.100563 type:complete len:479 (-) comp10353_c0_seq3:720-2156(-)
MMDKSDALAGMLSHHLHLTGQTDDRGESGGPAHPALRTTGVHDAHGTALYDGRGHGGNMLMDTPDAYTSSMLHASARRVQPLHALAAAAAPAPVTRTLPFHDARQHHVASAPTSALVVGAPSDRHASRQAWGPPMSHGHESISASTWGGQEGRHPHGAWGSGGAAQAHAAPIQRASWPVHGRSMPSAAAWPRSNGTRGAPYVDDRGVARAAAPAEPSTLNTEDDEGLSLLGGLEISAVPQRVSRLYAERLLVDLIEGTEAGRVPPGSRGVDAMRHMLGVMLWCCDECDKWAEDDRYAAHDVVMAMRAGAVALQVQLHRRLWPMCSEWQTGSRPMCAEHGPEILAHVSAPPTDKWPRTVAERNAMVRDLEAATSESAMAAVWAGANAEGEAIGRIEWLLAPGDVNWVQQAPVDPSRLTDITADLRSGKMLQLWIQIHRHDHPECRANEVGFKTLPGWGPALCMHAPKAVDPRLPSTRLE